MKHPTNIGPLAVRAFVVLVGVNAVIGIAVLMGSGLGATGGRILATSLALTAAVVIGLACATGTRTPSLARVWVVGAAGAGVGCALVVAGIWLEPDSVAYGKLTGTVIAICIAIALVCLTGLATLPPRLRWTFTTAEALAAVVVAMLVVGIWSEATSSWFWRTYGAFCVALAAFLLVIPVLSRVRRSESHAGAAGMIDPVYCPSCGRPLGAVLHGEIHCTRCGVDFVVQFRSAEHPLRSARG